ncbi:MAG: hypothetical protein CUN57_00630, partial [Phototrophicales bacterium]
YLASSKLTKTGEFVYRKSYEFPSYPVTEGWDAAIKDVIYSEENDSHILVTTIGSRHSVLLETDTSGEVVNRRLFEDMEIERIIRTQEGDYILGGKTSLYSGASGNESDLVLLKLTSDLEEVWSRFYFADKFKYKRVDVREMPDGSLVLAYSTRGAFPIILSKLTQTGEIVWQKGYALFQPEVDVMPDGSLLMTTLYHFDETHDFFVQTNIAKTDTLGRIAGCEEFPTC